MIITILLLGMLSGSLYTLSLLPPQYHLFAGMVLLERVVVNIIGNALRYTQQGGVLVSCRRRGDVVVADYRLPAGETGVQAIRECLQQHLPVLIVTGESLPETLQEIQHSEDTALLHKPVSPASLSKFLRLNG